MKLKQVVIEFTIVFAVALVTGSLVTFPWNLIPFCDHVRHALGPDKVTGVQRRTEYSIIENTRKRPT
jgi:hypothetical protein